MVFPVVRTIANFSEKVEIICAAKFKKKSRDFNNELTRYKQTGYQNRCICADLKISLASNGELTPKRLGTLITDDDIISIVHFNWV